MQIKQHIADPVIIFLPKKKQWLKLHVHDQMMTTSTLRRLLVTTKHNEHQYAVISCTN